MKNAKNLCKMAKSINDEREKQMGTMIDEFVEKVWKESEIAAKQGKYSARVTIEYDDHGSDVPSKRIIEMVSDKLLGYKYNSICIDTFYVGGINRITFHVGWHFE